MVVGTSAGAIVGAQLTSREPLDELVSHMSSIAAWRSEGDREPRDLADLIATRSPSSVESEDDWIAHFAFLDTADWPDQFRCTAVDLDSGDFAVWDRSRSADLSRAVASSCSVPGLAPPVTIEGATWIDGGARDPLNADVASGHDAVVAISCMALEPPEGAMPAMLAGLLPGVTARIEDLRAGGSEVEVVEPSAEFNALSNWGHFLLDAGRTADAFEAGRRQGAAEVERLRRLWT